MRAWIRGGADRRGGILGYPLDALYEEVAFVAYHMHWSLEAVVDMEHADRQRWIREISAINQRANDESRDALEGSRG